MNIYRICEYIIIFMFYSFLGWLMEVSLGLIQNKKFVNRGFLIGPYCPIYGYGLLLIVFLLKDYTSNALVLFILSMVICLVLEYLTSYFMELIFKARWWDYSDKKFNINGRVCLEYAIFFGLGGTLIMYIVHPFILSIVNRFSNLSLLIIAIALLLIYLLDNIISFNTLLKIKGIDLKEHFDNTEEITKKVKEHLMNHSKLTKRIANAFPNLKMKIEKHKSNIKKLKK